jgi:hypothetical protein
VVDGSIGQATAHRQSCLSSADNQRVDAIH